MGEKGSLTIGRIHDIPVRLHFTFLLILPYIAWVIARTTPLLARHAGVDPSRLALAPLGLGVILGLCLFACVLIHELAHVFVGLAGGAQVHGVTLMIVGGVSEITELPKRPVFEAAMAVAGPAASLALGIVALGGYQVVGPELPDLRFALHYLAFMNLALGIFNLVPAFPMDGGRILRAVLAMVMDQARATRIAAWVGQGLAVLFLAVGLFSFNWVLVLIGVLVFGGARAELQMVRSSSAMKGLTVEQAMLRFPPTVDAADPIGTVLARMERELKTTYFVVSHGEVVGTLTAHEVKNARPTDGVARAGEVMLRDVPKLVPEQDLASAARTLRLSGFTILPVTREGALLGSVSFSTIAAAIRSRDAARSSGSGQPREHEAL